MYGWRAVIKWNVPGTCRAAHSLLKVKLWIYCHGAKGFEALDSSQPQLANA